MASTILSPAVPETRDEADDLMGLLVAVGKEMERAKSTHDRRVAAINGWLESTLGPLETRQNELVDSLAAWAAANRDAETVGDTKTIILPSGTISWRNTQPKVVIENANKVLAALKKLKLTQFIRNTPSIDKEAMLKDEASRDLATTVTGVTIVSEERILVKAGPNATPITRPAA